MPEAEFQSSGDINVRVGNVAIEGILREHGVPGMNEKGGILYMCAEREMVMRNVWFMKIYLQT